MSSGDLDRVRKYAAQLRDKPEESKVRHIVKRLELLPMTLELLSATGIGKALNTASRDGGTFAEAELGGRLRALLKKWKEMAKVQLAKAQSSSEDETAPIKEPTPPPPKPSHKVVKAESSSSRAPTHERNPKSEKAPKSEAPTTPQGAAFTQSSGLSFDDILGMKPKAKKAKKRPHEEQMAIIKKEINGMEFALPKIAATYKPSSESFWQDETGDIKRSESAVSEIDTTMFQSKKARGKVFAGRKTLTYSTVPTLFDAAMRVICDNLDAIEDTGDIPYDLLRPALERATAAQLLYIEDRNPYLGDDSGPLWEHHCVREFRKAAAERDDDEEWRDFYLRQCRLRDERLKAITSKVRQNAEESKAPVRTAKSMALVKAPRDVRRKQIKNGLPMSVREGRTFDAGAIASAKRAVDAAPAAIAPSNARNSVLFRPAAASPVASSSSGFRAGRSKTAKAPLMAKIMRKVGKKR